MISSKHNKRRSFEVLSETTNCYNKTERIAYSAPGHLLRTRNVFSFREEGNRKEPSNINTPVKRLSFPYSPNIPKTEQTPTDNYEFTHHQIIHEKKKKKLTKPGSLERLDELLLQVKSDCQLYQIYESNPTSILSHLTTKHLRMSPETFRLNALLYEHCNYTLLNCCSVVETRADESSNNVFIFLPRKVYPCISQYFRLLWPYFETRALSLNKQTYHQRLVVAACVIPMSE